MRAMGEFAIAALGQTSDLEHPSTMSEGEGVRRHAARMAAPDSDAWQSNPASSRADPQDRFSERERMPRRSEDQQAYQECAGSVTAFPWFVFSG
jgi:hypothetical protein